MNNGLSPQIYNRYEGKDSSKHKRNLVIAGGVTLSVIVSPVVAAVTVGQSPLNVVLWNICVPEEGVCVCVCAGPELYIGYCSPSVE